ncbi:MAG: hypothetical protein JKY48_00965, partial [Flavobacteriales bacterium]|nr:hypothetical protein [Flavobacteriales bacterium]
MALSFLNEIIAPNVALALTSGPAQPEFSSFEPVATTNMVNVFSGDLTYNLPVLNIPGPDGGGYAMSLSYHSGASPEEEASWVGYGWTLNPGAINRGKRGLPDDWNNKAIKYHNKNKKNQTVSVGGSIGSPELFSFDLGLNANASIRYNNYVGFGYSAGAGITLGGGIISLGYNVSNGDGSFSLGVNPAAALNKNKDETKKTADKPKTKSSKTATTKAEKKAANKKSRAKQREAEQKKRDNGQKGQKKFLGSVFGQASSYGMRSLAAQNYNLNNTKYNGSSFTLGIGILATPAFLPAGFSANLSGTYSTQENIAESTLEGYGYMYASEGASRDNAMHDYYVEKGSTFNKRDKFLGIPFNNADNFNLSGEALGGSFRAYQHEIGHYHPNKVKSKTQFFDLGVEIELPTNVGGGGDIGYGQHNLTVEEWSPITSFSQEGNEGQDEPHLFRFKNDLGGHIQYDSDESPERAKLSYTSTTPGAKSVSANVNHIGKIRNGGDRVQRSSYIGYTSTSDMNKLEGSKHYRAYEKSADVYSKVNRAELATSEQIGEFSVVNEAGQRYNYGLPVYSRQEKNISIDLKGLSGSNITDNYLAFKNSTGIVQAKVGEERDAPYAAAHLLTSITGTNYVDRTHNGPSKDDFGSWTKFSYARKYGSFNKASGGSWFKWRMPYNGLLYNRNSLSNGDDDMGSYTSGEKEVYYLDTVITKTHVAVFRRSDRRDGYDAASEGSASSLATAKGSKKLDQLDRIDLYSVNEGNYKLIKSVRFEYVSGTSELSKGIPNGLNSSTGKLTLKKVWFEYEGVYNARISPYIFDYEYSTVNYPAPYNAAWASTGSATENMNQYGSSLSENPNYDPLSLDAWGNYQYSGSNRFDKMRNWVNQNPNDANFDPAAWQLKGIKLPSGGEIHIQYEQDDYAHVQDELAHAMVRLKAPSNDGTGKYYLDGSDIRVTTAAEKNELKQLIFKEYVQPQRKIYFKFLYKLIGNANPQLTDCNADYVTGYANVKNVGVDGNGVWVTLGGGGKHDLPAKVCRDFVKTQRAGKLSLVGDCDPSEDGVGGNNATEIIENFLGFALSFSYPGITCAKVNWDLSYLRVPVVNSKKGGGIRVKRLLTYDPGIDAGYPALYGSEYRYEVWDQNRGKYISSGVATNEPPSIREENVLIQFMERFKQSFLDKAIAGRDKKQAEGLIGESIMPGASVGYSRVVTQNIHTGLTNTGFSVQEFYTNKDYPYTYKMTTIDDTHKDYLPIPGGLVNIFTNNVWLSQGFAFYQNNMHGQARSTTGYGGLYDPTDPYQTNSVQVSATEQIYFEPGDDIPVMYSYGNYGFEPLGQEMDISFESRHVRDRNDNGALEFDVDVSLLIIPLPMGSAFPSYTYTNSEIYTHTTSKLITYPVVLKETRNYQDGIYHVTKNKYFDPATGKPVVTETYDDFNGINIMGSTHDGKYTQYDFKAHTKYGQFAQKSRNEKKFIHNMDGGVELRRIVDNGQHYLSLNATTASADVCDLLSNFGVGDLVILNGAAGATDPTDEIYHVGDVSAKGLQLWKLSYGNYTATNDVVDVEILHSGKSNQLMTSVGGFTTYGQPGTAYTPVDASIMGPRTAFATLLNSLLTGGITQITASMMPNDPTTTSGKLEIVYNGINCGPLPYDHVIRIEGNEVRVYKIIKGEDGCGDTTIVGTPSSPHGMVTALNNYFTTYSAYNLGAPSQHAKFQCRDADPVYVTSLYHVPNVDPAVATMRNLQTADLAQVFSNVNGGTFPINAFIEDDGFALGRTEAGYKDVTFPPSTYINQRVILRYLPQNKYFGLTTFCEKGIPKYSEGCQDSMPSPDLQFTYHMHQNWDLAAGRGVNYTNFFQTPDGYLGVSFEAGSCVTDLRFYRCTGGQDGYDSLVCNYGLFMSGGLGSFSVDPQTASLVYYAEDNACFPQSVECINFCGEAYPKTTITRVVASSANCFADRWDYDNTLYAALPSASNDYNDIETGRRNKWRSSNTYAYRELTSKGKNYESGLYGMELFNYELERANNSNLWLNATSVTAYSPNGNAVEEENLLGIKSAAKFGYDHTLPYAIAQNSDYASMFFESFENRYSSGGSNYFEDGFLDDANVGTRTSYTSHSGKYAYELERDYEGLNVMRVQEFSDAKDQGILAKVWLKTDLIDPTIIETGELLKLEQRDPSSTTVTSSVAFTKVAQAGEWILYEAKMPATSVVVNDDLYLLYGFTAYGTEQVWLDDIRVQPLSSSMTAYVYDDATQRLVSSFDDQHFGLLYQYNHEGKLVRKLMETERGVKTIQETQYNTQVK